MRRKKSYHEKQAEQRNHYEDYIKPLDMGTIKGLVFNAGYVNTQEMIKNFQMESSPLIVPVLEASDAVEIRALPHPPCNLTLWSCHTLGLRHVYRIEEWFWEIEVHTSFKRRRVSQPRPVCMRCEYRPDEEKLAIWLHQVVHQPSIRLRDIKAD